MAGLTIDDPVTLRQVALSEKILPDDVIEIAGGTYPIGVSLEFNTAIAGIADHPVIIRPRAGETVVFDGSVVLRGAYVRLQGIRVTNSNPDRNVSALVRPAAIHVMGSGQQIINCVIDNAGNSGVQVYGGSRNPILYGNKIFHCGIYEPAAGGTVFERGSAIYNQSFGGAVCKHNTCFRNLVTGGKSYGSGVTGHTWDGHVSFSNGGYNLMAMNYYQYMTDMVFKNCIIYGEGINDRPSFGGYLFPSGVSHGAISLDNMYMVISRREILFGWCMEPTLTNSHLFNVAASPPVCLDWWARALSDYTKPGWNPTFANNKYFGVIEYDGVAVTEETWFDTDSEILTVLPSVNVVQITPNEYDANKARVTVINWEDADYQDIALTDFLTTGDGYEVYDMDNYLGDPVASGEYSGSVRFRFDLTDYMLPVGDLYTNIPIGHSSRRFGCFEVRKVTP